MKKLFFLLLFWSTAWLTTAQCPNPTGISLHDFAAKRFYLGGGGYQFIPPSGSPGLTMLSDDTDFKSLVYSSGLWMAGTTASQELRVAVSVYPGNGHDFFPGPISLSSEITEGLPDCGMDFDRQWMVLREMALRHRFHTLCSNDPECDLEAHFPLGYAIHESLVDYPGRRADVDAEGAPFYDADGDGFYDPESGDFPLFASFPESTDCCSSLKGDYALLWFANDVAGPHSASNGLPIGIELDQIVYGFFSDDPSSPLYHRVKYTNRSSTDVNDFAIGFFIDADLGNSTDDAAGSDPDRDMVFFYNGDAFDEDGVGAGWGEAIPTVGFTVLNAPALTPQGNVMAVALFEDPFFPFGTSVPAFTYYNWLRGLFADGSPVSLEGDAHQWPGYPTADNGNLQTDVRALVALPTHDLAAGSTECIEAAYVFNRNAEGDLPHEAAAMLANQRDAVFEQWNACFPCQPPVAQVWFEEVGTGYAFMNLSGGDTYLWDFGDGTTSSERFPQHQYAAPGGYLVTLTVSNECGSASTSFILDVVTSVDEHANALPGGCRIYPNPASESVTLTHAGSGAINVQIVHPTGQVVSEQMLSNTHNTINVAHLASGMYLVIVRNADGDIQQLRMMVSR